MANKTCLFCSEHESTHHLFFDCCVASLTWEAVSNACGYALGADFESVDKWWLKNDNFADLNVMTAAAMWSIWKLRN